MFSPLILGENWCGLRYSHLEGWEFYKLHPMQATRNANEWKIGQFEVQDFTKNVKIQSREMNFGGRIIFLRSRLAEKRWIYNPINIFETLIRNYFDPDLIWWKCLTFYQKNQTFFCNHFSKRTSRCNRFKLFKLSEHCFVTRLNV